MPAVTLAAIAAGVAGAWSALVAPYRLRLTRVDAPVAGLPAALDGYRIAVLADLHHWPWIARGHVARAVRLANEAAPDLTVLLGDFSVSFERSFRNVSAWLYDRALAQLTPPLRTLRARDGVLAVLGNHDHYAGVERTVAWLPTIVLSHVPDGVLALDPARRVDLVLAGHTHGGQVVLPGYGAPVTMSRVATRANPAGWVPNARAPLFVSRGVGVQTPGRFFAPPEVVIVRLVRGDAATRRDGRVGS